MTEQGHSIVEAARNLGINANVFPEIEMLFYALVTFASLIFMLCGL